MLPIDNTIDLSIDLVCMKGDQPLILDAKMIRFVGRCCEISLNASINLEVGASAVITVTGGTGGTGARSGRGEPLQITGIVEHLDKRALRVEICRVARVDQRYFPREDGPLELRYRVTQKIGRAAKRWLSGLSVLDTNQAWFRTRQHMNFSASGLRFTTSPEDGAHHAVGDLLLIELQVPTTRERFRISAEVKRVEAQAIAVEFLHIPTAAVSALIEFTFERQLSALDTVLG